MIKISPHTDIFLTLRDPMRRHILKSMANNIMSINELSNMMLNELQN